MTTERTKEDEKNLNSFSLHLANLSSRWGKERICNRIVVGLDGLAKKQPRKRKEIIRKPRNSYKERRISKSRSVCLGAFLRDGQLERRGELLSFASHPSTAVCHLTSSQCVHEKWIEAKTSHTKPTQTTPKPNQNNNLGRHFSLSYFLTRFLDEILRILLLEMGMRGKRWTKETVRCV